MVKFGLVTDVHHFRHGRDLTAPMRDFVEEMNQRFHPNFVVGLGDFYGGGEFYSIEKDLREITEIFRSCESPAYCLLGNLDACSDGGRQGFKEAVEIEYDWLSFDEGDFHFILLDGAWTGKDEPISPENLPDHPLGNHVGHIPEGEVRWLRKDLAATENRTIIFCHYPIKVGVDKNSLDNEEEVVELFEKSGKVIAVFTGHGHCFKYKKVNRIHYLMIQAMGDWETFGSYVKVSLKDDELRIKLEKMPLSYTLKL